MSFQTLITASAASLAALYFLRGAFQDFRGGNRPGASACGSCPSGGCPVARGARPAR